MAGVLSLLISRVLLTAPRPEASRHLWHQLSLHRTWGTQPEEQETVADSPLVLPSCINSETLSSSFLGSSWQDWAHLPPVTIISHFALHWLSFFPCPLGPTLKIVCAPQSSHQGKPGRAHTAVTAGPQPLRPFQWRIPSHTRSCP